MPNLEIDMGSMTLNVKNHAKLKAERTAQEGSAMLNASCAWQLGRTVSFHRGRPKHSFAQMTHDSVDHHSGPWHKQHRNVQE